MRFFRKTAKKGKIFENLGKNEISPEISLIQLIPKVNSNHNNCNLTATQIIQLFYI